MFAVIIDSIALAIVIIGLIVVLVNNEEADQQLETGQPTEPATIGGNSPTDCPIILI